MYPYQRAVAFTNNYLTHEVHQKLLFLLANLPS